MITDKRIIFENDEGGISVICPSPKWAGTIDELAAKDVPAGKTYRIVDVKDVPKNETPATDTGIEEADQ